MAARGRQAARSRLAKGRPATEADDNDLADQTLSELRDAVMASGPAPCAEAEEVAAEELKQMRAEKRARQTAAQRR